MKLAVCFSRGPVSLLTNAASDDFESGLWHDRFDRVLYPLLYVGVTFHYQQMWFLSPLFSTRHAEPPKNSPPDFKTRLRECVER
jgi:hypothetical protein